MSSFKLNLFLFLLSIWIGNSGLASDHIDGVPTLEVNGQVDLTDLYAFPTPGKSENLTVIVNLYPGVESNGHFSNKVGYDILIRPSTIDFESTARRAKGTDEALAVISCRFLDHDDAERPSANGIAQCLATQGARGGVAYIEADVFEDTLNPSGDLRLFTGPVSDPFFISKDHFEGVTERAGFTAASGSATENLMETINVLTIALEIDLRTLFPKRSTSLYAIAAESFAVIDGQKTILDRVGRPEITNLSLHAFDEAVKVKRPYNSVATFAANGSAYFELFQERLSDNIAAYDRLDGERDWSSQNLNILTGLLLDDFLLVDVSPKLQCSPNTSIGAGVNGYFAIEKVMLSDASTYTECGGRRISDDVMNTLYALYIGGLERGFGNLSAYTTGVERPYQSSEKELAPVFPYLAAPELTGLGTSNLKRFFLNNVIKPKNQY